MANVFISYAREDRNYAMTLAEILNTSGWSVWWDREIYCGDEYHEEIEREVYSADFVLVLWTKNSIASRFVKNEATVAADKNRLIPIQIGECRIPIAFIGIHTIQMKEWNISSQHSALQEIFKSLSRSSPPQKPPLREWEVSQPKNLQKWLTALKFYTIPLALLASLSYYVYKAYFSTNEPVVIAFDYDGTTSKDRSGTGGFFNGCASSEIVEISVCQGPNGQYGSTSFQLRQGETKTMEVKQNSTFRYACGRNIDKTCPSTGAFIPLIRSNEEAFVNIKSQTCQEEASLESLRTRKATRILFTNNLQNPIKLYWIDHDGQRVSYGDIDPNSEVNIQTYYGHPWVITDARENCLGIYFPNENPGQVKIQ